MNFERIRKYDQEKGVKFDPLQITKIRVCDQWQYMFCKLRHSLLQTTIKRTLKVFYENASKF